MKKRKEITISECYENKDSCNIYIYNIGKAMEKIIEIIKEFANEEEFFIGHFRTDGVNLKEKEFVSFSKEIPEYYKINGRYELLNVKIEKKSKIKVYNNYLAVGSLPVNNATFEILPKLFNFYLDTILFCPKVKWKEFVQSYSNYINRGASNYIMNGATDFLFCYHDSGDLLITFNSKIYNKKIVYEKIIKIVKST